MQLEFTAVFQQVPEGHVGFVEGLPGANTRDATLAEESLAGQRVIREPLRVSVA